MVFLLFFWTGPLEAAKCSKIAPPENKEDAYGHKYNANGHKYNANGHKYNAHGRHVCVQGELF